MNVIAASLRADPHAESPLVAEACSPSKQNLIILPTEKCNFRCTYCYEDFVIGKMSEQVQHSIERFLDIRVPELRELALQWFGGEPLVARQVLLRIAAYAKRLCDEHNVRLRGALTTNAWLLGFDLFEELLSYDQRFFQITLDGWRDHHDAVRRRANGLGTFERIWSNLLATRKTALDFEIQLRIHVRRGNEENLAVLLQAIAQEFGDDPRYSLDFEHLRNLGGEGGRTVEAPLSLKELREVEGRLRRHYEFCVIQARAPVANLSVHLGGVVAPGSYAEPTIPGGVKDEPYVCYASKPNSLLIRADGRIGKCTVALTDVRNTIGRINEDGSVTIDSEKLQPWIRGLVSLDEEVLGCPLTRMPAFSG